MNYPNGELAPIAQQAAESVYNGQNLLDYKLERLTDDPIRATEPVAVAARFAVDGTGIYSGLVLNDSVQDRNLSRKEIEACVTDGQSHLAEIPDTFEVGAEEAEAFIHSGLVYPRNNVRLELLAGIQVMYSSVTERFIPAFLYNASLRGFAFFRRERFAGTMLSTGDRSYDELLRMAGPEDEFACRLISAPHKEVVNSLGFSTAKALVQTETLTA